MTRLEDRDVIVVGLGVSGFAAARALASLGAAVRVTESGTGLAVEQRADALRDLGVEVETGGHSLDRLRADLAVVSPGIPPTAPVVVALRAAGTKVIGEVELAHSLARCDFLAVTGTNGKTTTTTLLAAMLAEGGATSTAAGNIGTPLVEAALATPPEGAIAVEVSSFQLASIETFRPRVGVVLNVGEDHTDWHGSFGSYVNAKARITENQKGDDVLVVNADDEHAMAIAAASNARTVTFSASSTRAAARVDDGSLVWRERSLLPVDELKLQGLAGLEDSLAAACAALEYGIDAAAVARALRTFEPLAHRLQIVAVSGGVTYVDDSKATNPHATVAAVRGFSDVVLIAGGRSKGIDLSVLADLVPPVRAVVALGEARDELERVFAGVVPVDAVDSMRDAVRAARGRSNGKGSVLLSPACASLDMYPSYVARGEDFAREVRALVEDDGGSDGDA